MIQKPKRAASGPACEPSPESGSIAGWKPDASVSKSAPDFQGWIVPVLALSAITWITRYWHFRGFGLYEDDHYRISATIGYSWQRLYTLLEQLAKQEFRFHRLVHELLIYALSGVSGLIGGIDVMYIVGFGVLALNAVLLYAVWRKLGLGRTASLAGGLVYCLHAADVSQVFLTHAFGTHPAVTVILIGALFYLSGRRVEGILCAVPALFIYESFYLLFLAIPLLAVARKDISWKRAGIHWGFIAAGFVAVASLRLHYGDNRTTEAAGKIESLLPQMIWDALRSPYWCLRLTWERAAAAAGDITTIRGLAFLAGFAIVAGALWWAWQRDRREADRLRFASWTGILWLTLVAVLLTLLSYPLLFDLGPAQAQGRASRVHMAAVVGLSLLAATFLHAAQTKFRRSGMEATIGITAACAGFLVLHGFRVQDGYVESWAMQRAFWTDIVRGSPDIDEGTLILVQRESLRSSQSFNPWSWEVTRILSFLHRYPESWAAPPRLFLLRRDWRQRVARSGDLSQGFSDAVISRQEIEQHCGKDAHFYDVVEGRLQRIEGPLRVGDHEFVLKPPPAGETASPFPEAPFYRQLILAPGETPVDYLVKPSK